MHLQQIRIIVAGYVLLLIYVQGKAKKRAWQKVVDEGITKEQAQERYVELVEKLKTTYGYDANKEAEAVGGS
jgi:diazepam-binding inhibitor (GABA receptor modulating acyl-CoA-binding protein)